MDVPKFDRLLLGVTATPNRGDEVGLSSVFDEMVYTLSMLDAIREGWLSPPSAFRVQTDVSLRDISFRGGQPNDTELAHAVETPYRNALIVDAYRQRALGRRAGCFAVNIQHARNIAQAFNDAGVKAVAIWSGDPEREAKEEAFAAGEYDIFCNVAESAIRFADSLIPIFGGGIVTALKQSAKPKGKMGTELQWNIIHNLCKTEPEVLHQSAERRVGLRDLRQPGGKVRTRDQVG